LKKLDDDNDDDDISLSEILFLASCNPDFIELQACYRQSAKSGSFCGERRSSNPVTPLLYRHWSLLLERQQSDANGKDRLRPST